ncbi:MAG TPA: metallophosphoesterase [Spirochaetia bacterium]|nr:metallophosphoesterase [Spirochaetia bacterium]
MKILCVADHVDPLVYSTKIKERFRDIDMVLGAGDLPMEYLGFIASSLNRELYFVFGNHNLNRLNLFKRRRPAFSVADSSGNPALDNYFGSIYVGGKIVNTRHKLLIAGLGGSMLYNGDENQFTEFQMYWKIFRLVPRLLWNRVVHGRFLDILLTHAPPRGIHDKPDPCHTGFESFLWFMRKFKPRFLLHGHIHLYDMNAQRVAVYHETTVVNVYDHYVLTLPESGRNQKPNAPAIAGLESDSNRQHNKPDEVREETVRRDQ